MELCLGRGRCRVSKGSASEGNEQGTGCPGQRAWHLAAGVQEAFIWTTLSDIRCDFWVDSILGFFQLGIFYHSLGQENQPVRAQHSCMWMKLVFFFCLPAVEDTCVDNSCVGGDCLVTLTKPYYRCSCSHPYKLPDCQQGECSSAGTDPTLWGAVVLSLCWLQVPSARMMLGDPCSV